MRTLRFYRERKLLPPPRREGRIAWYDDDHLARLRTISALLERGHTLSGIAELAEAFDNGRGVGELLGLGAPTEEVPVRLSPEELADAFGDQATSENLAAALDLGYLATDGTDLVHISRRLLDVSAALVREGIPSRRSYGPAAAYANTRTPWPSCSPASLSHGARPRPTWSACGRSRRAWWRRSCRWRWTGGCGRPSSGLRGPKGCRRRSRARGPTTAPHAWPPAPRTP